MVVSSKKVLFLDQLDSFTYNITDMLIALGATVSVVDAEELGLRFSINNSDERRQYLCDLVNDHDAIVLGPGPGKPSDYCYFNEILAMVELQPKPVLGICLGLQAIAEYFGWEVIHAISAKHGKQDGVVHRGSGLFQNVKNPMKVGRYHSLVVSPKDIKNILLGDKNGGLEVIGMTALAEVMALKHDVLPIAAVQFHPESVLTLEGKILLSNWLRLI